MPLQIEVDRDKIAEFCRKHHIRRLAFFGSVLREDFGPDSDVDVLVEFAPEQVPGLFRLVTMESELSDILGRKADLRTAGDLSRYFRDEVVAAAEVQYAA
ncbi:MAG: nucleotidyltransferase family protein [candidate division WS1 bacterium]|jgi:predicted nucleotidyltransferase|nr:nucleotidyltransferase family protein [candidate division WS1 bacterium]